MVHFSLTLFLSGIHFVNFDFFNSNLHGVFAISINFVHVYVGFNILFVLVSVIAYLVGPASGMDHDFVLFRVFICLEFLRN